ncbi:MAG: hypothetical protein KatS3mg021_1086 [Fimbriimonadales bacterium]|nr:MAG: hypothetical protein KatS3mg021_1086 [Fimbriimonadales bacterium]
MLYRFPKERTVYGPSQIEARINQVPEIVQQINLWNQQGTQVFRGHLLVIPLGNAMLYFRPIYLRAVAEGAIPELKRVILASGDRVVMTETVEEGLAQLLNMRTPAEVPTTRPTEPTAAPADLKSLARRANQLYREAQDALKAGDWATYGAKMKALEGILRQMAQ